MYKIIIERSDLPYKLGETLSYKQGELPAHLKFVALWFDQEADAEAPQVAEPQTAKPEMVKPQVVEPQVVDQTAKGELKKAKA